MHSPIPNPRFFSSSSSYNILLSSSRNFSYLFDAWALHHRCITCRRWSPTLKAAAAAASSEQNHYSVLGISKTASSGDIKKAYRLLARKYHPDVSQDSQASEVFKSIRLAYEVLSDEISRARYDTSVQFPLPNNRRYTQNREYNDAIYRWAKLRQRHMHQNRHNTKKEESTHERGPFNEVLRFAFFTVFIMDVIGHRASLALCGAAAVFDQQLDVGYKFGYLVAFVFGGRGGILLALCVNFASWVFGKRSSSIVAIVLLALWIGANLACYVHIPRGAIITLLYMSIKLHVDSN